MPQKLQGVTLVMPEESHIVGLSQADQVKKNYDEEINLLPNLPSSFIELPRRQRI